MQRNIFIVYLIINKVHFQDNDKGLLATNAERLLWNIEKDPP